MKKPMNLVSYVSIAFIILRIAFDCVSFLFDESVGLAREFGYPINEYWIHTVFPVTASMLFLAIIAFKKGYFDTVSLVPMLIIPLYWFVYQLITAASNVMVGDGISWLFVAVAVLLFNFWKR
jgi:uncharacterized membrane protein